MKIIFKLIILSLLVICFSGHTASAEELHDFWQREMKLPEQPQRIISLTPATTEILFALGLEKNIAGVTKDCNYPLQAAKKPKVGKFGFIDLEKLISLKPDLIFATSDMKNQLNILKQYKVPVIALDTPDISSVIRNIEMVGKLTGSGKQAVQLKKQLNTRLEKVKKQSGQAGRPKVFYCIWHDPLITAGNNSFIGDMISLAGGVNLAGKVSSSFAKFSIESLVAGNPDFIIIPNSTYKQINFQTSPWNRLRAVKMKKVLAVDEDLYLRPAPRIIQALEDLQVKILK